MYNTYNFSCCDRHIKSGNMGIHKIIGSLWREYHTTDFQVTILLQHIAITLWAPNLAH